jgi:hypothetical protein
MKIYTYEEWKTLLNLNEKDHRCPKCNGGKEKSNCTFCEGDGHTLKLAYLRARNMEIARIRRWGVK